jgi:hypothetical protein
MNIPPLTPVESSQISHIGHDPAASTLFVKFKRGGVYSYSDVTDYRFWLRR